MMDMMLSFLYISINEVSAEGYSRVESALSALDSFVGGEQSNQRRDEVMSSERTMWARGLCVILALAFSAAANATVICPSGGGITCVDQQQTPGVFCSGDVTSSNISDAVTCTAGANVNCSFTTGDPGNPTTIAASHVASDPLPSSCTWSCLDGDGAVDCIISDSNSGLPVTMQSFSVD